MDKMSDINLNEETSEENGELRRSLNSLDGWDFEENAEVPSRPEESPPERPSFSPTGSNISRASSVQATDQLSSYSLPGATLSFHQQPYSHYPHQGPSNYGPGYYGPPPQHGGPLAGPPYTNYQPYQGPPHPQNPNFYQPIPQYRNYPNYGAPSPAPGMYPYYPMQGYDQGRQRPYPNEFQSTQRYDLNTTSSSFDRSFGPTSFHNSTMPAPPANNMPSGYTPGNVPPPFPSAYPYPAPNNLPPDFNQWYQQAMRWWHANRAKSEAGGRRARLTPPFYPMRHSRVTFGPLNQLVIANGKDVIIHHLQPMLIDIESRISISSWPGPLVSGLTDKADIMEFIRAQDGQHQTIGEAVEVSFYDKQKRQIWQILKLLVQLNGNVSGADIAELLLYHNEAEFSVSENSELNHYRRLLTLGQRKNALEFATKNGLWDHFWALTCLTLSPDTLNYSSPPSSIFEAASKFINTKLNNQDALYVLYRCLLNKLTFYNKNATKPLPISNLQHFTILLANDCEINSVVSAAASELLNFIIALRNNDSQHLIAISPVASLNNDPNIKLDYSEELIFINEIFEFSRNCDEIIVDFIPYKVLFTCKLFDFGFIDQAKKYCEKIREAVNYYTNQSPGLINYANVNWEFVTKILDDLESRITGNLIGSPSESYVASSDAVVGDDDPSISEVSVDNLTEDVGRLSVGIDEENAGSLVSSPHKSRSPSITEDQPPLFPRPSSVQFQRPEPVIFTSKPEPFNILSTQSSSPPVPKPIEIPTPIPAMKPPSPPSPPMLINSSVSSYSNNYPESTQQQQQQQQQQQPQLLQNQQNFNQPASLMQPTNQLNNQRQNQPWRPRQRSDSAFSSVAGDNITSTPPQTPRVKEPAPWVTQVMSTQQNQPFAQSSQSFQSQPQPFQQQQHQQQQQQQQQLQPQQQQFNQDFIESGQSQPMSYISVQSGYDSNRYDESEAGQSSFKNNYNFNSTTTNGLAPSSIPTPIVSPIASPATEYNQMRSNSFDTAAQYQVNSNERETEVKRNDEKERSNEGDTLDSKTVKQKGVFDFLFSKLPSLPKRAVLPDDKDPSIIWDEKLQKWINKDEKDDPSSQNLPSGPPKIPIFNQSMGPPSHESSQTMQTFLQKPPQSSNQSLLSSNFPNLMNSSSQSSGTNPMIPPMANNLNAGTSFNFGDQGFPAMDPSRLSFVKSKQKRWVDINSTTR